MKSKLIINESNLTKVQKQPLFMIRKKHVDPKIIQQPMPSRDIKSLQKSIQECITYIEQQVNWGEVMETSVCEKIKEHLNILRQKYKSQDECVQNQRDTDTPHLILRKQQSNKYFTKHKIQVVEERKNKQNANVTDYQKRDNSRNNTLFFKQDNQVLIMRLQDQLKRLNDRLINYQSDCSSLNQQINHLKTTLANQISQKNGMKQYFQDNLFKQKKYLQNEMKLSLSSLQSKLSETTTKLGITTEYLIERQKQITTLWQILKSRQ